MGQNSNKGPFTDWIDYQATTGDEQAFLKLIDRAKAERDKSEDEKIKADINLYIVCCHLAKALYRDKNYGLALKMAEETLANQDLLDHASAVWEAYFYKEVASSYKRNGDPEKAIEFYQNSAAVRLQFFSHTLKAPDLWQSAARVAYQDLRNNELATSLIQRSIDYAYRWSDGYKSEVEWLQSVGEYMNTLAAILEKAGRKEEAGRVHKDKEELVYPKQKAKKQEGDQIEVSDVDSKYDLYFIVENAAHADRNQLQQWLKYCNEMIKETPNSGGDFKSLWRASAQLVEAQLQSDPVVAIQIIRGAITRFVDYKFSTLIISAYQQGIQLARQASLPGLEQDYLHYSFNCYNSIYGVDHRLTLLAKAAKINGPLERVKGDQLVNGMSQLLKAAKDNHPDDQELISQLRAMAPADALTDSVTGEISPERQKLLEKSLSQLEEMIGISQAKDQIEALSNFISIQQKRQAAGEDVTRRANHFIFTGPPGTGKTTVARLLGNILYSLEQLPTAKLVEVTPGELIAGYTGQTAIKTREVIDRARGGVLFIDEAYQLGSEIGTDKKGFGGEAMAELILAMENDRDSLTIIFAGYQAEMSRFMETNSGLASRVTETINFPSYEPDQLVDIFKLIVAKNNYQLDPEAEKLLPKIVDRMKTEERERFGNGRAMRNLFEDSLLRQAQRLSRLEGEAETLSILTAADLSDDNTDDKQAVLDEALAELDGLIGLDEVKKQVHGLRDLLLVRRQRQEQGLDNQAIGNHLVFTGPPGTGKTTVARIIARILYGVEQLPTSNLVEGSSTDMIAAYLGQTAIKTRQLVRQARGGVLFIDEAYSLMNNQDHPGANAFAREALAELIKLMEDERENLVVILAGYSSEMERLLDLNPGMRSRISEKINFPAYSADELFKVCQEMVNKAGYQLSDGGSEKARELCEKIADQPVVAGGNARDVRGMVEDAIVAQAGRLAGSEASREQLLTMEASDLAWRPSKKVKKKQAIGFAPEGE